jgi:hypothetical protein
MNHFHAGTGARAWAGLDAGARRGVRARELRESEDPGSATPADRRLRHLSE